MNKVIELNTENQSGIIQTTKIDNSTEYKDYKYEVASEEKTPKKTLIIKNYTDENSQMFEINGITIFGEHLQLLKDFLNK